MRSPRRPDPRVDESYQHVCDERDAALVREARAMAELQEYRHWNDGPLCVECDMPRECPDCGSIVNVLRERIEELEKKLARTDYLVSLHEFCRVELENEEGRVAVSTENSKWRQTR